MSFRWKLALVAAVVILTGLLGWKRYLDSREPVATNQPLPQSVPDEAAKETIALRPTQRDGKWGYINRKGELAMNAEFDFVGDFSEGLAQVHLNNKWGMIDKTGKVIVESQFQTIGKFQDGVAPAGEMRDGRFVIAALIDRTGKIIWRADQP